jgi:hypothetical membrane protein
VVAVRAVPWWGLASSAVAPVVLIGGWTIAADLQPGSFDAVSRSISTLAAYGATDRWVMTLALLVVGCCDVITGLALYPAAPAGRLLLMAGGLSGVLVAANPQPAGGGLSVPHVAGATLGCVVMTIWPVAGRRREPSAPAALNPPAAMCAAAVMSVVAVWFALELLTNGGQIGLAERVLTGAQTTWPLVVMLTIAAAGSAQRTTGLLPLRARALLPVRAKSRGDDSAGGQP